MISSAYKLCRDIIRADYPSSAWNIDPFHFSDGDNWSMDDTLTCIEILTQSVLPKVNLFSYGQVESQYGSGQFVHDLREHFNEDERVVIVDRILAGRVATDGSAVGRVIGVPPGRESTSVRRLWLRRQAAQGA